MSFLPDPFGNRMDPKIEGLAWWDFYNGGYLGAWKTLYVDRKGVDISLGMFVFALFLHFASSLPR
jgi:hypothetical protein